MGIVAHLPFQKNRTDTLRNIATMRCCDGCNYCCKKGKKFSISSGTPLYDYLNMNNEKYSSYFEIKGDESRIYLNSITSSCGFFNGTECSIYNMRPEECKQFPFELNSGRGIVTISNKKYEPLVTLSSKCLFIEGLKKRGIKYLIYEELPENFRIVFDNLLSDQRIMPEHILRTEWGNKIIIPM